MTEQYDNSNRGVLFPNAKKTKANQPALRGSMNLEGVEYWASAWRKISKETQKPYISIALQEKDVENAETINAELHPIATPKSEKAPTFEGVITIDEDEELPIVAWVRQKSTDGTSFFTISVDNKEESGNGGNGDKIDDSDIFFGLVSGTETVSEPEADFEDDLDVPF